MCGLSLCRYWGVVSAGEDGSTSFSVTINTHGKTGTRSIGFGKMRPLKVIKYKRSVTACRVFLYLILVSF